MNHRHQLAEKENEIHKLNLKCEGKDKRIKSLEDQSAVTNLERELKQLKKAHAEAMVRR